MTPLAKSIYNTLAFFDAQDMPPTLQEIKTYLTNINGYSSGDSLPQIQNILSGELSARVEASDGFYFLKGRAELVSGRKIKYRISLERFKKAKKYLKTLRFFPYLRAVAISGSQALLNSSKDSDIDLFVITQKNRIWLARMLVSFYFQILGQRRHGLKVKGRFCLNHYVSQEHFLAQDRNLYTAVEYASLLPVLGERELNKFRENNKWLYDFLPQAVSEGKSTFFGFEFSRLQHIFEFILDFSIGPILNWLSGLYQKRRIKMQEYILVSDAELSFHPGSRGQKVLTRYSHTLGKIGG